MQTHFGFQTIDESDKESRVRGVFDNVASRYDVMNDVMSAGLHRLWKREMVAALSPKAGQKILDVAGGTGDIAFRILKETPLPLREGLGGGVVAAEEKWETLSPASPPPTQPSSLTRAEPSRGEGIHVTICDINESMLNEGKNRAIDRNLLSTKHQAPSTINWTCGNAESLPFPDNHFDAYTIAFGIRNVTHIDKALAEAHRVLKIGGKFLCLEFSPLENETLSKIYDAYSFNIIPWMGERIANDRASYQYLVESIRKFPSKKAFAEMIRKAGFGNVIIKSMTGGIVALHSGRKL